MKTLSTLAIVAAVTALSGCVVAPARGDYRDHGRYEHRYDNRYDNRDRSYYDRHNDGGRRNDGDHAGGTGTPD